MKNLLGKDLRAALPGVRDWSACSVGEPMGDGLKLGYEGWGNPDVALDPMLPLDMCLERLGLFGSFREVRCHALMNYVHGDCMLRHAATGLRRLLAPGGVLRVRALDTAALATTALMRLDVGDVVGCQVLERLCFKMPVDLSGLVFQQTFLSPQRLNAVMGGCLHVEERPGAEDAPRRPDDVRIPEAADDAAWEASERNMTVEESLDEDRPTCAACRRVATKADWNRAVFSRYCKDHYCVARASWEAAVVGAYTFDGVVNA